MEPIQQFIPLIIVLGLASIAILFPFWLFIKFEDWKQNKERVKLCEEIAKDDCERNQACFNHQAAKRESNRLVKLKSLSPKYINYKVDRIQRGLEGTA